MAYAVVYKCRKCGVATQEGTAPSYDDLIKIVLNIRDERNPHFRMLGLHRCADGTVGVTDFVGADEYSYGTTHEVEETTASDEEE